METVTLLLIGLVIGFLFAIITLVLCLCCVPLPPERELVMPKAKRRAKIYVPIMCLIGTAGGAIAASLASRYSLIEVPVA